MVKKLIAKKLKTVGKDSQLSATIRESAQQIWLAGLGAFAKAQQEGNKVFDALIREGEAIQQKTRKVTEDKVTEMAAKATHWDKLVVFGMCRPLAAQPRPHGMTSRRWPSGRRTEGGSGQAQHRQALPARRGVNKRRRRQPRWRRSSKPGA
jgi:hypothetical protein